MKSGILTTVLILLALCSQAQYFGLESSEWKYRIESPIYPESDFVITYDHDTILNGFAAVALKVNSYQQTDPYGIIRFSGDSVFYWSNDQFLLLYDFGADIGDTWVAGITSVSPWAPEECSDSLIVEVTDVGTVSINGTMRRYISLTTVGDAVEGIEGKCVEGIGLVEWLQVNPEWNEITEGNGFLPGFRNCIGQLKYNPGTRSLCYYTDDMVGYYYTAYDTTNCGLIDVAVQTKSQIDEIQIHPNPTTGQFTVQLPLITEHTTIEVFDIHGRSVHSHSNLNAQTSYLEIDLTDQPTGLYVLKIYSGEEVYSSKLMKN